MQKEIFRSIGVLEIFPHQKWSAGSCALLAQGDFPQKIKTDIVQKGHKQVSNVSNVEEKLFYMVFDSFNGFYIV